jgi:hypothetical protein
MAAIAAPALTVGLGLTTTVLFADVVPHEPPLVVRVNVAVPEYPAGGVHVAFKVVAVGLKVPPAGVDHVPPVAPPPTDPPSAAEVPPWQIAAMAGPMFTVGFGLTVKFFVAIAGPHKPPDVVRVKVTSAGAPAAAVYVVVFGVRPPLFVKLPPAAPSDHIADVALPPNDPPSAAEVPPWQMAAIAPPALTVGLRFTVIVLFAEVVPHEPPLVVRVKVAVPL